MVYLKECLTALTNYLVDKVPGRDLVDLRIRKPANVQDKVVGINFRRRDQFKSGDWSVWGKGIQSNASFALTDRLEVNLDHVKMPAGNGKMAEKTKFRPLNVLSDMKNYCREGSLLCSDHALIITMAQANGDPKYKSYRNGYVLHKPVEELLKASGVDL